jgi:hypothetical protein
LAISSSTSYPAFQERFAVAGELEALQAQRLGLSQRAAMMAETQREFEAVAHML